MAAKVISIINKKGGVAKTTSTGAIACILGTLGLKVLIIDADPQINITALFGAEDNKGLTICDLIQARGPEVNYDFVRQAIVTTQYENIDIIPGDDDLDILSERIIIDTSRIPQMILSKLLTLVKEDYDFILIDNSPYFNVITRNSLCASKYALIPLVNDRFSYDGLAKLLRNTYEVKGELNPDLDILGVFFTKAEPRTRVFKQLYAALKSELPDILLDSYIRKNTALHESNSAYIPFPYYKPTSPAVTDYMNLILELNILDDDKQAELEKNIAERHE